MRSFAVRFGGVLIFLGALVLSLEYVNWATLEALQRADLVIAAGIALLICFVLALISRSLLFDELVHLFALVVGAAVLGLFTSGVGIADWVSLAGPVRADKTLSFDGTFAPEATSPAITVQLTNGSVTVQTWDQEIYQIVIRARARGWSRDDAERALEEAAWQPELSPGGIRFSVPRASLGMGRLEADVQLFLPSSRIYELQLETLNGRLEVAHINATQARLKSLNGRITLREITAQSAILDTLNGQISGQISAGEASVSTMNGAIQLTLARDDGNYRLSTFNGRIGLDVPQDPENELGYSISARSLFGSITVRIPDFLFREQERRRVEGATHNFSSATHKIIIQASTTNGSIEIR
jgi:hypothetical protein